MPLEIKLIKDPGAWAKIVEDANKERQNFPEPTLNYDQIHTRWKADYHVVIGMETQTQRATTGYVRKGEKYFGRVFKVPVEPITE